MKKIDIVLLKYGEIALKGLNRPMFEQRLLRNLSQALAPIGRFSIRKSQSMIYVEPLEDAIDMEEAIARMRRVFGIVNICPAVSCEKDMDSIAETTIACLREMDTAGRSFKVEAKREDKQFPLNSPQICQQMGGYSGPDRDPEEGLYFHREIQRRRRHARGHQRQGGSAAQRRH